MEDMITYLANDTLCHSAIEELRDGMKVSEWVEKYYDLFHNVTYQADELPRIADCHYNGVHYNNISSFCILFQEAENY
jgi:hypothetical protein